MIIILIIVTMFAVSREWDVNLTDFTCDEIRDAVYNGECLEDEKQKYCFNANSLVYYLENEC